MGIHPRRTGLIVDHLPFSPACENNKGPILAHLRQALARAARVLEIGSGTGQHAECFAGGMPWLTWQPTETAEAIDLLRPRCSLSQLNNLLTPQVLDVRDEPWPLRVPDAIFTANTLHIMPMTSVEALFRALAENAPPAAILAVYGPFNYGGRHTSESNAQFDASLRARSPHSGIRDIEAVSGLAAGAGFTMQADHAMPANNRLVVWHRSMAPE